MDFFSKAIGSSMMASVQNLRWFNAMPNQVLEFNGQDQIVRSGNYCSSSIRVASIGKHKNTTIERLPWLILKPLVQTASLIARAKNDTSCWGRSPGPNVRKISSRAQTKQKLLKCKLATFNVKNLNRIDQLPEPTASTIDHNIDTIYIQEHWYLLLRSGLRTFLILNKGQTTIWEEIEIYSQEKLHTIERLLVDKNIGLVNACNIK